MPPNIPNIPGPNPVAPEMGQEPSESLRVPEHMSWNPRTAVGPVRQEVEDRNNYHHHHSQWVIQAYGVQESAFPPQRFFNNPTYPSYLLEIGQTFYPRNEALNIGFQNQQQQANEGFEFTFVNHDLPQGLSTPSIGSSEQPWQSSSRSTIQTHRPFSQTRIQLGGQVPQPRVIPKNRLSDTQKLAVVRYCIEAVEDYGKMGKTEFFGTQREIVKRREGFDCNVEAVMSDIIILAKVYLDSTSESRSGVAVASTDLDQAAVTWAELLRKKEEQLVLEKKEEKGKKSSQEMLSQVRLAMTQKLAQRSENEIGCRSDLPLIIGNEMGLSDEEDIMGEIERGQGDENEENMGRGRERKNKREWKERPGAGLSAGKRQKLADAQDESFIRALDLQDEKAGRFYRETLTTGIDKLVSAITQASQPDSTSGFSSSRESQEMIGVKEQLTKQEKQIADLARHQVLVEKKLEEAAEQRAQAEKKNEEQQQRMMELLKRLAG